MGGNLCSQDNGGMAPVASAKCIGNTHDFMMLNALAITPAAEEAPDHADNTINKVLHG